MTDARLSELLKNGEGLTAEFKRCSGGKAYGGADLQLTDGDVFRTEVSLKTLELAPISPKVALKGAEVAPIGAEVALKGAEVAQIDQEVAQKSVEVAQKGAEVAQKLVGKGRADAINNAVAVFNALQEDGSISIEALESMTKLSNGSVKNAIRLLRLNGIIKREGADRGGRWVVLV